MISTLPKIVDKNFVIAYLIPAILGCVAVIYLYVGPNESQQICANILTATTVTNVGVLVLCTWTVAFLLVLLNIYIYRLLEGYMFPLNFKYANILQKRRFRRKMVGLSGCLDCMARLHANADQIVLGTYLDRLYSLRRSFPLNEKYILPTRFGNVIRAFEVYPYDVYGAEGTSVWLRLLAVMPKRYNAIIDDARGGTDFFVNIWFIAFLLAAACIATLAVDAANSIYSNQAFKSSLSTPYQYSIPAAIAITLVAYQCAVYQAREWGDLVRAAFDLYLPSLASQLGYNLPMAEGDRREFWGVMTNMFLYGERPVAADSWWAPEVRKLPEQDKVPEA